MKITKSELTELVKEEMVRRHRSLQLEGIVRRLTELYPGSSVGSWLKQAVTKMWEADALIQKSLSESEDEAVWNALNDVHKALESLTYKAADRMEKVVRGDISGRGPASGARSAPKSPPRSAR